ncbi:MAG: 3-deoxy-D-manno-octulosonic acid transferase [Planctomycetota bacterium]
MSRVTSWLLNGVYATLILLAAPWIAWSALRHGKYREGLAAKLWGRVPKRADDRPCIWLHAVSVGEVQLLQTLLEELRQRRPDAKLVISTTTKTGYDLARRKYAHYTVFYCPLDFSWAVSNALRRIRPDLLVLTELEIWPNLILAASDFGAKIAIVNGRLSDRSYQGYRRIRPVISRILRCVDLVAVQSDQTAQRFLDLGSPNVTATGSIKFDGAVTDRDDSRISQLRSLANIADDEVVLLAGSTQAPEEQYAIDVYQKLTLRYPRLRLIIVPRHPQRFDEVARLLERSGIDWIRRSALEATQSPISNFKPQILVDSVGELSAWWGLATIGFVGGSFGTRGGQNMLEPAVHGVATCFGPNTRNFRDIVAQLIAADGARVVRHRKTFEQFVEHALADPAWAAAVGQRAKAVVLSQQGATRRTVDQLMPLVAIPENARRAAAA